MLFNIFLYYLTHEKLIGFLCFAPQILMGFSMFKPGIFDGRFDDFNMLKFLIFGPKIW